MSQTAPFLEMRQISKGFPGVQALDGVGFDLRAGEVHALVGENGAGKSTLMKVLSGVYQPDGGEIWLQGRPVSIRSTRHARTLGIAIVHQELNLFPNLTVAENLYGGRMPTFGWLRLEDRKQAYATAREFLGKFDLPIDPNTPVNRLSIAQQQVVEISKALAQNACVLILDEPTSSLSEHETELLFNLIAQLKAEGLGIVYISHRLEEIFRIGDRVTVLRDGHLVGTTALSTTNIESVIRMMVGRQLKDLYGQSTAAPGQVVLDVQGLNCSGCFRDVSFQVRAGEIVGMAGLIGAGRSDIGLALFGAQPISAGRVLLNGQHVKIHSPDRAMALGIAYLSENRHSDALFGAMPVTRNITVSHLSRFTRLGMLNSSAERAEAQAYIQRLNVATPNPEQKIFALSGGNQQKVILSRWLAIEPRLLIVDEPTRGIDIGAKVEIYTLLHSLAAQGVAILLISSEMPEILGMSDRILVMHDGQLTGELDSAAATEEKIMILATSAPNGGAGSQEIQLSESGGAHA